MKGRLLLLLLLLSLPLITVAQLQPLPVDQVFQFSATAQNHQTIVGSFNIAPGYYLYRDRLYFSTPKASLSQIGQPVLPATQQLKSYPNVGQLSVYTGIIHIPIPIIHSMGNTLLLQVQYQGCAEQGYCYPPTTKLVSLSLAGNYGISTTPIDIDLPTTPILSIALPPSPSTQDNLVAFLTHKNFFFILMGFFVFGLLLSFTPCVLPMIPILSSIIVGQKDVQHSRAIGLSLAYVLGMALTYALAGIAFGWLGGTVQAALQRSWVLILFSVIFVLMALSLFGLYTLQLPAKWRNYLAQQNPRSLRRSYWGATSMGGLSTLILSPCVTPPLVGVLGYIGQTGNVALGGSALFIMGIGMGVPLLIIGVTSARWLPKAGAWMNTIKYVLGVLLLGLAIETLSRLLSGPMVLSLWAALAIGTAIGLGAFSTALSLWKKFTKASGILLFVYCIILVIGAISGNANPFHPLATRRMLSTQSFQPAFLPVKTVADVKQRLQQAQTAHQWVLLDFYADWCITCKEINDQIFNNPTVQKQLSHFMLLRADVTQNDAQDKQLQQYFNVIAPPTLLFFTQNGHEITPARIVGEVSVRTFLTRLTLARDSIPPS